jgi:hypothetical protein
MDVADHSFGKPFTNYVRFQVLTAASMMFRVVVVGIKAG